MRFPCQAQTGTMYTRIKGKGNVPLIRTEKKSLVQAIALVLPPSCCMEDDSTLFTLPDLLENYTMRTS